MNGLLRSTGPPPARYTLPPSGAPGGAIKFEGPFALQFANLAKNAPGGAIKWRKVEVRSL